MAIMRAVGLKNKILSKKEGHLLPTALGGFLVLESG